MWRCRLSETGDNVEQGRRTHRAPPGLGQTAEVVAGTGGGHHLRFRQLHLPSVQRLRHGHLHFQTDDSRYTPPPPPPAPSLFFILPLVFGWVTGAAVALAVALAVDLRRRCRRCTRRTRTPIQVQLIAIKSSVKVSGAWRHSFVCKSACTQPSTLPVRSISFLPPSIQFI